MSSILSHDTFWNAVVTMPMTKKMLQLSLKKCGACGEPFLKRHWMITQAKPTVTATNAVDFTRG